MNQTDFSEIADCSVATIQSIETGRLELSADLAARITIATFISTDWLRDNDAEKPMESHDGQSYSKDDYDLYQATSYQKGTSPLSEARILLQLLGYYELMRRVLNALNRERSQLAYYRIQQFFAKFIEEFTNRTVTATPSYRDNTLELVARDVKSAKKFLVAQEKMQPERYTPGMHSKRYTPGVYTIAAQFRKHLRDIPEHGRLP